MILNNCHSNNEIWKDIEGYEGIYQISNYGRIKSFYKNEGTANRKISEKNGFKVWLCAEHHNMSNNSVHFNREMSLILKKLYQKEYEKTHSREEFIKLIGRNYLDE